MTDSGGRGGKDRGRDVKLLVEQSGQVRAELMRDSKIEGRVTGGRKGGQGHRTSMEAKEDWEMT